MTDSTVNDNQTIDTNNVGTEQNASSDAPVKAKTDPKYVVLANHMKGKGPMTNEQICAAVGKDSVIAKNLHVHLSAIGTHGGAVRRVREGGPTTYELIKEPVASPRGRTVGTKLKNAPKRSKRVLKIDLKTMTKENIEALMAILGSQSPENTEEKAPDPPGTPSSVTTVATTGNSKEDFARRMREAKEKAAAARAASPDDVGHGADRIREGVRKVLDTVPDRNLVDAFVS